MSSPRQSGRISGQDGPERSMRVIGRSQFASVWIDARVDGRSGDVAVAAAAGRSDQRDGPGDEPGGPGQRRHQGQLQALPLPFHGLALVDLARPGKRGPSRAGSGPRQDDQIPVEIGGDVTYAEQRLGRDAHGRDDSPGAAAGPAAVAVSSVQVSWSTGRCRNVA